MMALGFFPILAIGPLMLLREAPGICSMNPFRVDEYRGSSAICYQEV